jgi:hypothetical protein
MTTYITTGGPGEDGYFSVNLAALGQKMVTALLTRAELDQFIGLLNDEGFSEAAELLETDLGAIDYAQYTIDLAAWQAAVANGETKHGMATWLGLHGKNPILK